MKEKLVQKEGEAAMLASINKQVTLPKVKIPEQFPPTSHRNFYILG